MNCSGRLVDISRGAIMGILNITPDSFYSGSRYGSEEAQLEQCEKMLNEGATFIDIGGYSTRPGADDVPENEEMDRVLPVIERIHKAFADALISIDTFRSRVARAAIDAGACLINDVSGGDDDKEMYSTAAALQVPYVLMHRKGTYKTMQKDPYYDDVVPEVLIYFSNKLHTLRELGVHDVIVDPGFGFGKNIEHNYTLLNNLHLLGMMGCPVLAGVSRKGMIHNLLNTGPENSLNGTTVVHTIALMNGASVLRVHDVKEAKEALEIVNFSRETI
ncbi:MAG: dihydropteroate synthase [Bacteroidota bacterium]|nr:dihydropteroate synthase [Bacteroidota bacterium]